MVRRRASRNRHGRWFSQPDRQRPLSWQRKWEWKQQFRDISSFHDCQFIRSFGRAGSMTSRNHDASVSQISISCPGPFLERVDVCPGDSVTVAMRGRPGLSRWVKQCQEAHVFDYVKKRTCIRISRKVYEFRSHRLIHLFLLARNVTTYGRTSTCLTTKRFPTN